MIYCIKGQGTLFFYASKNLWKQTWSTSHQDNKNKNDPRHPTTSTRATKKLSDERLSLPPPSIITAAPISNKWTCGGKRRIIIQWVVPRPVSGKWAFFEGGKHQKLGALIFSRLAMGEKPSWVWVREEKIDDWSGLLENLKLATKFWAVFFFSGKHGLFLLVVFFFGDVLPQGTEGLTHYMEEGESLEA